MAKKKIECIYCKHYDGKNCTRNGNVGILVKNRKESKFYISTPDELNKNKDCESYVKLSKKQKHI